MPKKPSRACNFSFCPNTVNGNNKYCRDHKQYEKAIFKDYDKRRRRKSDKIPENFYRLAKWKRVRDRYRKEHPYCEICENEGRGPIAMKIVDHKVEIEDGGSLYDFDNLQSLCMECHNRKTFKKKERIV